MLRRSSAGRLLSTVSRFTACDAGTSLPDGTRWGPFDYTSVKVEDPYGLLVSNSLETLASGFRWSEGPVWCQTRRKLFFSDTVLDSIFSWQPGKEGATLVARYSGGFDPIRALPAEIKAYNYSFEPGSNGMSMFGDDSLVICQHFARQVIRVDIGAIESLKGSPLSNLPIGSFDVLAKETPTGRPFNSPNDVIVADGSTVYFTDPIYGFLQKTNPEDSTPKGVSCGLLLDQPYLDDLCLSEGAGVKGVYKWSTEGARSSLSCVTTALHRPNGLALSRDGSHLWVANSVAKGPSWSAFALKSRLAGTGETFVTSVVDELALKDDLIFGPGLSDGFKIDQNGNIWSTVPGGFAVIDPKGMIVLAKIFMGTNTSNLQFGDDGDVFITGLGHLWRIQRQV